ncbi:uncharacterized protein LOC101856910 [Aplysia californica]|uniref:Uncharacterized protein LOC101856910 n=1 Tax=Aplysia californica TaxID=6500 RepID=A0ABM1A6E1_APLCA|nr:uncharacterized protein LOC101856910 [Aplysia californica]XP_012941692.1 uncharacterized protein LOC101856910 [Aplysia californica]XP_012941694.1 uncharacterized protein LOC101856910 [Aplysia californica]XP_035827389.1 uncharacterized protein LOC101856910 [Aplysia californica]
MSSSLVTSFLLLITLAVQKGAHASCSFPDTLNMARTDPPWYSHVRSDGSRDAEYYIRHNVMEIHYPNNDRPHVRWKCTMSFHGKLLLKRQDIHINSFYRCAKFIFRSRSIVQIMWSHEIKEFDLGLCENEYLKLDPWPLIWYDTLEMDHKPCPFHGGYDMKLVDSQLGENGCNLMLRPMRLEAECLGGEGVTFDYVSSNCLPDINMFVKQRTLCVTDWQDSKNHYVILRRNEDTDLWCLVMPIERGSDVTAHLYSDLACHYEVGAAKQMPREFKYFTLQLHTRVFSTLCEDEYHDCNKITCNDYVKHECHKSCGMCNPKEVTDTCSFPRRFSGSWFLKDTDGYKHIELEDSQFAIDGVGNFKCMDFPDSPSRKSRIYSTVSFYTNGCRPRYTCIKFQRLGPSVLRYSQSQSYVWPALEHDFGSAVCDEQRFHPDPSPIDDLYRSHAGSGKPIVAQFPRPEYVHCNVTSVLTISATLPEGYVCSGRMYRHCEDTTKLRLEFGSCGSLIPAHTDYSCLANFKGHYWERILLVQNTHDEVDVICFIFSQFYPNEAYAMVASQCDQKSFNFVRGGLRKPLLKLEFRPESDSCVSVPLTEATTLETLSRPEHIADPHKTMSSDSSRHHANESIRPGAHTSGSLVVTLPPAGKGGVAPDSGSYNNDRPGMVDGSKVKSTSKNDAGLQRLSDRNNGASCICRPCNVIFLQIFISLVVLISR